MILNESISNLSLAAEPLKAKAEETELVLTRSELEKELSSLQAPWSVYLQELIASAQRKIFIATMTFNPDRSLEIRGNSGTLQAAAEYKQKIDNLSFTKDVELTSIVMNSEGRYDFQIRASIVSGEEVIQD